MLLGILFCLLKLITLTDNFASAQKLSRRYAKNETNLRVCQMGKNYILKILLLTPGFYESKVLWKLRKCCRAGIKWKTLSKDWRPTGNRQQRVLKKCKNIKVKYQTQEQHL